ncbi:hypothetical protein A2Z67_01380 [Candidatus Woesebacteria bacterium RBG_13_36_22]|uniref:Bacterial toxin RNase RnlA/LsoA DBD domain-containing protein n=1 Tax=Candidatus Woesebacteria bacterium RBG_13_36_22 TaxID=1802478 RepID=A0A1F7X0H9_9BACT|nr:MAG: hypothetical protein A2Z67_01380 [Candidatus Woesebacteria bacterium RBG_13_36_22]
MNEKLEKHNWWGYIHKDLKDLVKESYLLINKVEGWEEKFNDYAFVIFPAAKAYEGFLKTLFYDMGFITDEEYFGKRFRIGKALNPALEENLREKESVYDKLVSFCQGKELPNALWETWKGGRNLLFHWFPDQRNAISFSEAKRIFQKILMTMDLAFVGCKINK